MPNGPSSAQRVINTLADESSMPLSSFVDRTFKFPLFPMIAGLVVVFLTVVLAVIARWQRILMVTHSTPSTQRLTLTHQTDSSNALFFSDSASNRFPILASPGMKKRFKHHLSAFCPSFSGSWYFMFNILVMFPFFPFTF